MKRILTFAVLFALVLGAGSCKKLTDELYQDPNNPTDAPAEIMLPGASIASALIHEGEVARLTGMWSGYFVGADRQYTALDIYDTSSGDYDSPWENAYAGAYAQADIIQNKAEEMDNKGLIGIAKVHKALIMGTVAALWGDVPFKQANKIEEFARPSFDAQKDVYTDVIALLESAISDFETGKGGLADKTKDIFFGGDLAMWKKTAHSLLARNCLHIKDYAKASLHAKDGFTAASEGLMTPHGESRGNFNIFYYFLSVERRGYMQGSPFAYNLMRDRLNSKSNMDTTRIKYYFSSSDGKTLNTSTGIFAKTTPFMIIGSAEVLLVAAESILLEKKEAGISEALSALNLHRKNLNLIEYDESDFSAGGIENKDNLEKKEALRREILEEKYVSLFGSIETFNDLRRTWKDDVRVKVPIKNSTATSIPMRLLYPQSEINTNPNVPSPLPGLFDPTPVNK